MASEATAETAPAPFETAIPARRRARLPWSARSFVVDALMLALGGLLVDVSSITSSSTGGHVLWYGLFAILALLFLRLRGAYAARFRLQVMDELRLAVAATAVAAMTIITIRILATDDPRTASDTVKQWVFATAFLAAGRLILVYSEKRARRYADAAQRTLIIGAGKVGQLTARRLLEQPEFGLKPIGFLDKEPLSGGTSDTALPILGASWDLLDVVEANAVEHVVVTFSTAPHNVLLRIVKDCQESGIGVSLIPRLFEKMTDRLTVDRLGGLPIVSMEWTDPKGWQFAVKYLVDRVVALFATLLLSPLFLVLGAGTLVSLGRPIFYRQSRVGRDGRAFDMLKFRTMRGTPQDAGEADAAWAERQLDAEEPTEGDARGAAEDRRTPFGRFMRKFSLDELPQLWNVVRGDMSLVGPRPERVAYVERFEGGVYRYNERHRVKAGITGWAQVHGLRGQTSLADRVEWDNYYIENWSLWLDLKIVGMTISAVFRSREA